MGAPTVHLSCPKIRNNRIALMNSPHLISEQLNARFEINAQHICYSFIKHIESPNILMIKRKADSKYYCYSRSSKCFIIHTYYYNSHSLSNFMGTVNNTTPWSRYIRGLFNKFSAQPRKAVRHNLILYFPDTPTLVYSRWPVLISVWNTKRKWH